MNPSEKLTFPGANGAELAARLEHPARPVRGYALFAHCFTCSKDVVAASRISKALADQGFGVVRFDFTGLGNSQGDFAHTNFSSNVQDLLAAVRYMREHLEAPAIMIGHSLGGAATLMAAGDVPECRAVATIGAPHDPKHVEHLFSGSIDRIEEQGEAEVSIGGRAFKIQKQFIDDLRQHNVDERIGSLKRALLVFHSPVDELVSIDNARDIYLAAKHPKSFITLDQADHLLRNPADASYVASVLSAWAARYLDRDDRPDTLAPQENGTVVVRETDVGKFQQEIRVGAHVAMFSDEPESVGGNDTGPGPYDFLLAGLGACTSMTMRMYADHKKWPMERVTVSLRHEKKYVEDATQFDQPTKIDHIYRRIKIEGSDLDEKQRARLLEIADRCPVHRTLHSPVVVNTEAE
ncbi:MAG: alpha/beta fold hydrolase [Myxococcota bacterium]